MAGVARPSVLLDQRFGEALEYALGRHRTQTRDCTTSPLVGHLLAVASLVIEDGGDEDQAIAALLSQSAAEGDGKAVADIAARFGARVGRIVRACSDRLDDEPRPSWQDRKEQYVERLPFTPPESWRVSLAVALSLTRSYLLDVRRRGPEALDACEGGRAGMLWYLRALGTRYREITPGPMTDELDRGVDELESLAGT